MARRYLRRLHFTLRDTDTCIGVGVWIEYRKSRRVRLDGGEMDSATSTFGLVERFKRGETEAFSLIFRKYRRRLAVLVHYKMSPELRGAVEVEDVLQEVFLAAAQDISNFT